MRILLDQAIHHHRNVGNNALLEAPLTRLRHFWPDARFDVLSISPHLCTLMFPGTYPVFPDTLQSAPRNLRLLHRILPPGLWQSAFDAREFVRRQTGITLSSKTFRLRPVSFVGYWRNRRSNRRTAGRHTANDPPSCPPPATAYSRLADYDLYVATGGAYLSDYCKRFLLPLFDRLEAAMAFGIPTIMVGQGSGPMADPEVLQRARRILPQVSHITIRDEWVTGPVLMSLNVPPEKVTMTGDDAVQIGYDNRSNGHRNALGVSLRVAPYTQFSRQHIELLRPLVQAAARRYRCALLSAPIDSNDVDASYINETIKGYHHLLFGQSRFERPVEIIKRIHSCRVMMSGTYHGAVFALSQGIPVIGIVNSPEYYDKLAGLAAAFGGDGCRIVRLGDDGVHATISRAIDELWSSADRLGPKLLENAKRQVRLADRAYETIAALAKRHMPKPVPSVGGAKVL